MAKRTTGKPKLEPLPDAWRLVQRQQLAEMMGVHPDTVTDYARGGMPVVTRGGRGKESAYDSVLCLAWQRQQMGKNAKEAAQTRAYEATANLSELKLSVQKGELFPRDQIVREGQSFVKGWVAHVRALPRRLEQAGIITRQQEPLVAAICRDLLDEISRWKTAADTARKPKARTAA